MSNPTTPAHGDEIFERVTIPVNLAQVSIDFVDWVRTTIPGLVGRSHEDPPERCDVIELGLMALYDFIVQQATAAADVQDPTTPAQGRAAGE